jgi:hypothetical protein
VLCALSFDIRIDLKGRMNSRLPTIEFRPADSAQITDGQFGLQSLLIGKRSSPVQTASPGPGRFLTKSNPHNFAILCKIIGDQRILHFPMSTLSLARAQKLFLRLSASVMIVIQW